MTDAVLISVEHGVGRLRLNRPKAIHALNLAMCEAMTAALLAWLEDPAVRLVILDHAEGRGFCAGGDVRAIWESGKADGAYARRFFFAEYRLNHLLFTYAKPIVAFMDGITMGGGVGIALPARFRVATERTSLAMPETGIGLFPDVGGGWYLSRLPGRVGQYIGLTGARIGGGDCLLLGLATHYVASDHVGELKLKLLQNPADVEHLLEAASAEPQVAAIAGQREAIDRLFAADKLEEVLDALDGDGSEWAVEQRKLLAAKSPQACKVTLRLLAQGRDLSDFADEMRVEYRVATRVCQRNDFLEGVRALLVDKDNAPRWDPAAPEGVSDHMIDRIFVPLDEDEEWVPLSQRGGDGGMHG